jgi:hypothetical protein
MAKAKVTRSNIDKEFARQGTAPERLPSEAQRDALAQLATGLLNASLGAPGVPQEKVREQIIANVVWAYLYPQDPRDVHAAMTPRLVAQNLAERGAPKPSKDVVTALAEVAIGWVHEGRWPWPSMGRLLAVQAVVSNYLAAA